MQAHEVARAAGLLLRATVNKLLQICQASDLQKNIFLSVVRERIQTAMESKK